MEEHLKVQTPQILCTVSALLAIQQTPNTSLSWGCNELHHARYQPHMASSPFQPLDLGLLLGPQAGTTCSPVPTGTQVTAQSRTAHQRFSQPKESSEDCFTPLLSTPPTSLQPAGAMRGCDRKSVLITVSLFIPHFSSAINSCRELAPRFQTSSRYDTGFSSRVFKLQLQKQKNIYMRLGKRVRKSGDQGHLCPWTDFLRPPHNSLQSPAGNPRVFINLSLPCSPGEHRCSAQRQEGADRGPFGSRPISATSDPKSQLAGAHEDNTSTA